MLAFYLGFNALMYAVLALWCAFAPEQTSSFVGLQRTSPGGQSEYLAVYGGLEMGLAAFFGWAVCVPEYRRAALLMSLLLYLGIVAFRSIAVVRIGFGELGNARYFYVLEILLLLAAVALAACSSAKPAAAEPAKPVVDFRDPAELRGWSPIDDVVMGGVSSSSISSSSAGSALFAGTVSLEHGGGFASVRSPDSPRALAGRGGLRISFRGDGKRYKLRLRTNSGNDGIAYQAAFETKAGSWSEARLSFRDFVPVFRGQVVRDAPALDPAAILSFGLMISDTQAGPFRLELARIDAF